MLATRYLQRHNRVSCALCGRTDYLAPYVNRIDAMGVDVLAWWLICQLLLDQHPFGQPKSCRQVSKNTQIMRRIEIGRCCHHFSCRCRCTDVCPSSQLSLRWINLSMTGKGLWKAKLSFEAEILNQRNIRLNNQKSFQKDAGSSKWRRPTRLWHDVHCRIAPRIGYPPWARQKPFTRSLLQPCHPD